MNTPNIDTCGTRNVDGKEIIQRLAVFLKVNSGDLEAALWRIAIDMKKGD